MATRIGKYKVSKREAQMSLMDGGTSEGAVTFNANTNIFCTSGKMEKTF